MLEGGVNDPLRDSPPPLQDSSASSNSIDFRIAAWKMYLVKISLKTSFYQVVEGGVLEFVSYVMID
jgi:hypothetical protein